MFLKVIYIKRKGKNMVSFSFVFGKKEILGSKNTQDREKKLYYYYKDIFMSVCDVSRERK